MQQSSPVPFRPDPTASSEVLVRSMTNAATALMRAQGNQREATEAVRDDRRARSMLELRNSVSPAVLADSKFAETTIAYMTAILGGAASAPGAIIQRSLQLRNGGRNAAVWVPGIGGDATNVVYIGEGAPIPIRMFDLSAGVLLALAQKLAFAVVLSNELMRGSNAEAVIRTKMSEDLRLGVDRLMFDGIDGSAIRPPSLLFGITPESAISSDTTIDGMVADLALICSKVAGVAGLADAIIVASPQLAVKIWARLPDFRLPVFASAALADEDAQVVAVACSGIAVSGSPDTPKFDSNTESVVVMQDENPEQLGTAGTLAYPAHSLFQADSTCLRLVCDGFTWAPRASSGVVAMVEGAVW